MENNKRLSQEKSPYLLQHQHNPVNWYTWGEEALSLARAENKIILLSIGYSTCYWCHVMERDSFESEEVAAVLNESFISIKVDREERPDLDKIYMDAVVALTGQGGWPLNVFLTPDLKPFFGGTFFPKDKFIPLLDKIQGVWQTEANEILQSAESITAALKAEVQDSTEQSAGLHSLERFFLQMKNSYDATWGGFGGAPKFPPCLSIQLLLRYFVRTGEDDALSMAAHTLEQMARGGIYDHLGGGFSRYSTDERWTVPHFEKMLYDNALLARSYLEAFQVTRAPIFKSVATETLDYILERLRDENGGFYCAEDAGEVGREGEFYVWSWGELEGLLKSEEFEKFCQVHGASAAGNFEDGFIILTLAPQFDWSVKEEPLIRSAVKKLLAVRNERRRPHLDDKILTSWNALCISALTKGFQVSGDAKYLEAAQDCARFLKNNLSTDSGELLRRFRDGDARFPAYLDDYAYLIQALLDLYESDSDETWIMWATELQSVADTSFWDESEGNYFYTTESDSSLIVRKKDYTDGAVPSGNGTSALNLQRLYHLTQNKKYKTQSERVIASVSYLIERYPSALTSTLLALDFSLSDVKQIAVVGNPENRKTLTDYIYSQFMPNKVMAFKNGDDSGEQIPFLKGKSVNGGGPRVYLCEKNSCKEPLSNVEELKKEIANSMGIPEKAKK